MTAATNQPPTETVEQSAPNTGAPGWLIWVVVLLCLGMGYMVFFQLEINGKLNTRLTELNSNLSALQTRTEALEGRYTGLKADSEATAQQLGMTEERLARAHKLAQQVRKEEHENAAELKSQLGSLNGTVGEMQGDVTNTRQKLEQVAGDLGAQSGLIAHTREELQELKRRGERNYSEFDLRKSKLYTRVGSIPVRLIKVDPKRNKYTLTLLVNDKRIDKKDKTLYEPVQFYPERSPAMLEIVVFEIGKDRVAGYLSAPKELAMRQDTNQP